MKLCILDADYLEENNKSVIRLFCKDEKGKTVIALDYNFEPYFYVLPIKGKENEVKKQIDEKFSKGEFTIKRADIVERIVHGVSRKLVKVTCFLSTDTSKMRDMIKAWEKERAKTGVIENEYEYTISFYKRYMIDRQIDGIGWVEIEGEEEKRDWQADRIIRINKIKAYENKKIPPLKIMAFDIENVEQEGKQNIIMLSIAGNNFKKVLTYMKERYPNYVEVVNDEKELLERFVETVNKEDPDIVLGYNCFTDKEKVILENGKMISISEYVNKYRNDDLKPKILGLINNKILPVEVKNVWEYNSGPHIILKIKTATGREFRTTIENKFLIGNENGIEWIQARKLNIGNLIATPKKLNIKGKRRLFIDYMNDDKKITDKVFIRLIRTKLRKRFKTYKNAAKILKMKYNTLKSTNIFSLAQTKDIIKLLNMDWNNIKGKIREIDHYTTPEIDTELMYIAGLIATDGTISKNKRWYNVNRIDFGNTDKNLINAYIKIFRIKFGKLPVTVIVKDKKKTHKNRFHARISCSVFKDFLNGIGISQGDKDKSGISYSKILSLPEKLIGAFIAGTIDGDGNVHGDKGTSFYLGCKNKRSQKEFQVLATRLGIIVSLHERGPYFIKSEDNRTIVKKLIIPFMRKKEKKKKFLKVIKTDYRGSLDVLPLFFGNLLKQIRNEHGIRSNSFKRTPHSVINRYENANRKAISRYKAKEIANELKTKAVNGTKEIEEMIYSEIFWDRIKKIEIEKVPIVYDLTTSSGNFIINNMVAHNSDQWDFQIIQKRADALKVDLKLSRDYSSVRFARRARTSAARFKGRVHVDLFNFVNVILGPQMQTEVFTLDAVSAELLGDQKIEMEFEEILETWRKKKDLTKLAEYCLKDSELTYRLGEFLLPQMYELSRLSGQVLFDTSRMMYSQLVEWYLSKRAFEMNQIIPNQPKFDEIRMRRESPQYVGGFVKEPIPGIHEGIAVMDFRSLYPSIIASFNISPETFNCSHCRKDGYEVPEKKYWFCKRQKGFVSTVIRELIERRSEIKEKMKLLKGESEEWNQLKLEEHSIKITANAMYGSFGFPSAKWFCRECAESAAAFGRSFIHKIMKLAEESGFVVLYTDTDSMFVKLAEGKILENKVKEFLKKVNKELPGILELDLQGIYKRGIFIPRGIGPGTAKKKYALIDEKGNLTIRGLERVRRDWSNVARKTQEVVLKMILEKKDVKGSVKYVQDVIKQLKAKKISLRELTIYEQLTKPLSEYKAVGPHVVAARKMKERGRPIGAGMVIMFAITKGKGSISQRAEPIEDVEINDIDIDYYVTHQIVPAALRVLTVLGVTEEQLLGQTLKGFL